MTFDVRKSSYDTQWNQSKGYDDFSWKHFSIRQANNPLYTDFVTIAQKDNTILQEQYEKAKKIPTQESKEARGELQKSLPDPLFEKLNRKLTGKEEYKEIYGKLSQEISSQLQIPNNLIDAIVQKESSYWVWLEWNGSVWIMQLTKRPMKDMRGDNNNTIWVNKKNSEKYQAIYNLFDFEKIKNISIWNGSTLKDTLPNSVWGKLESIKNVKSIKDFQDIMWDFLNLIKTPKWKEKHYYHTLNMIIWSVYFKSLLNKEWFNISLWEENKKNDTAIYKTLTNYNWNNAIGKDGRNMKYSYTESIMKNWKKDK